MIQKLFISVGIWCQEFYISQNSFMSVRMVFDIGLQKIRKYFHKAFAAFVSFPTVIPNLF